MSLSTGLQAVDLGFSLIGGAMDASAARKSARAAMSALKSEKAWNLGVMRQNIEDTFERSLLDAWGSGIDPSSGSMAALLYSNENTLRNEMNFREEQYDIQLKNLNAQSKQKFLGIF